MRSAEFGPSKFPTRSSYSQEAASGALGDTVREQTTMPGNAGHGRGAWQYVSTVRVRPLDTK